MSQDGFIKTACQACEGRLELPLESVGIPFACPRCGTKLELAFKCACEHCGGPLSFPADAVGHHIDCGHCHGSTLLMPSAIRVEGDLTSAVSPPTPAEPAVPEPAVEIPSPAPKPASSAVSSAPDPAATMDLSRAVGSRGGKPAGGISAAAPAAPAAPQPKPAERAAPPRRPDPQQASGVSAPARPAPGRPSGPPKGQGVKGPPRPAAQGDAPKPESPPSDPVKPENSQAGVEVAAPRRPGAAAPAKKSVVSPGDAAAARQAAGGGGKVALTASQAAAVEAEKQSGRWEKIKEKAAVVLVGVVVLGIASWFFALPLLEQGGDDTLVSLLGIKPKPKNPSGIAPVAKARLEDIEVDESLVELKLGAANLAALSGKVKNSGKKNLREIRLTFEVTIEAGNATAERCSVDIPKLAAGQELVFSGNVGLVIEPEAKPMIKLAKKQALIDEPAPPAK